MASFVTSSSSEGAFGAAGVHSRGERLSAETLPHPSVWSVIGKKLAWEQRPGFRCRRAPRKKVFAEDPPSQPGSRFREGEAPPCPIAFSVLMGTQKLACSGVSLGKTPIQAVGACPHLH